MNHKRRKCRSQARDAYSSYTGFKSRLKGNAWDRLRVHDHGLILASDEETSEARLSKGTFVRVLLPSGAELYRVPVHPDLLGTGAPARALRASLLVRIDSTIEAAVKALLEDEPLAASVRTRRGDVEVVLDVIVDEIRGRKGKMGLEVAAMLAEPVVERLAVLEDA